jgi:transposase InsO family protein
MAYILEQQRFYPIAMMCLGLKISTSAFYKWKKEPIGKRKQSDLKLTEDIKQAFEGSRGTYGSPRVRAALSKKGIKCGRHRVAKLMKKANIVSKTKRKFKVTTDSKHKLPVAENILNRKFAVASPNQAWVQDITYIWTTEGWLYLAVVIDLYSRKVVGWSIQDNMRKALVIDALDMAVKARKPGSNLLVHSDRGSQYCSSLFQANLKAHGMICSMSGKGECWDNAVAESFFHSLKTEHVYLNKFKSRQIAKQSVFEFIEVFYNRDRLHSTLGFCSPVEYEDELLKVA